VVKLGSDPGTFGAILRQARLDAGMTQSQLVRASGIPKPTLSRYENGHVMPSLATLARLADALDLPDGALLPGRTSPKEELFTALTERGIEIHSREDAQRIAEIVAREVEGAAPQQQQA
jgi:transcriptional regulator with XRE-family HTH domain